MTPAPAIGRPSPASPPSEADIDNTSAAREHRLSGRWADAEFSEFPNFTAWRLTANLSRRELGKRLVAAGFQQDAAATIARIEAGQIPTLLFVAALVRATRLTREQALALFTVNGNPIL